MKCLCNSTVSGAINHAFKKPAIFLREIKCALNVSPAIPKCGELVLQITTPRSPPK